MIHPSTEHGRSRLTAVVVSSRTIDERRSQYVAGRRAQKQSPLTAGEDGGGYVRRQFPLPAFDVPVSWPRSSQPYSYGVASTGVTIW